MVYFMTPYNLYSVWCIIGEQLIGQDLEEVIRRQSGRDADPSPSYSAEVKNRVELFVAYERVKPTYSRSYLVTSSSLWNKKKNLNLIGVPAR